MFANLMAGWAAVFNIKLILILLFSVPLGIVVGVLPGVGAVVGVTVLLPLTFGMDPMLGICMLVAAVAPEPLWKRAYRYALDHRFRFYSYGDAMLILPCPKKDAFDEQVLSSSIFN